MSFENHPLHPGGAVPLFISPSTIKEPVQLERFMEIEDPLVVPLLGMGGFTHSAWPGNAKPGQLDFIYRGDIGMAGNCLGLPNPGKEGVRALKEPIRRLTEIGIKTLIQVTNLPHENPLDVVPVLVEIAADSEPTAVEVNLSCPNGKKPDGSFHPPLSSNADASAEVMFASRERVGPVVTLGAKDSPHVSSLDAEMDEGEIERLAAWISPFIDFITGINTIGNQEFPELTAGNGRGGMSGPIVAPVARKHAELWNKYAPRMAYLSVGGVDSANADLEVAARLAIPNVIRVGGAQEFYRARQPHLLAARWAIAIS